MPSTKKVPPFKNETYVDFSDPAIRRLQEKALAQVTRKLGKEYPLMIAGKKVYTKDWIESRNPAHPTQVIGRFAEGTRKLVDEAITKAAAAFEDWKQWSPEDRADILFKAAQICRDRRYEINAWMILEVGKNWPEADADTAEGIDFLEYYGRQMLSLAGPQPVVPNKGEKGYLEYLPLGVGLVIPPWNFPFAILLGTTAAALVTGNTVVLKPSSDSPMMGWLAYEILLQAGLPKNALTFFASPGGEVGDALVKHPLTRFVSFTGSKQVGLRINQNAAEPQKGQKWIKRVVAEMGGKDAIVVAKDADLDEAADGIVAAAFGFQGQKCSACSRAIIEKPIYNKMLAKIVERVHQIDIGDPIDNMRMGPVVSERAYKTIQEYIKIGKKEARLIAGGDVLQADGYYIEPTVFADVAPDARIAQEEIFGPVLAIIPAKNYDEALEIANNTEFGLTGAVYTKSRKNLERAEKEFFVGNLYLNRKCTGALVGVHPFGGFNMSGTDSKAGGPDYLHLFLQPKSVAEKIVTSSKRTRATSRKSPSRNGKSASRNGKSPSASRKNVTNMKRKVRGGF
ncbi:MAG TPA: L-glutamate gamma-semialdehyde dehydrogenase [Candidatus Kapabacteria bacterium]|nr:L-glutamate gamma-semialdehyde dehydrogenase [Candidatus Kapabacteria bacterium]